ncbi:AAA family ATPase [Streptomyces sp. NPDC004561]
MRLLEVEIPRFKNLRDFRVEFDGTSGVAVLVGRNGAGKSNLLEAITLIFRDLDLGATPSFAYRIRYLIGQYDVEVSAWEQDGRYRISCSVGGENIPAGRFTGSAGARYRPRHVFGYYSGPSNRLEDHFVAHQERFYKDLVGGNDRPIRPLFYARNVHSNFVLLAFFLDDDPAVQSLLRDHLGIQGLDSVLFVMQKPSWNSNDGDPRFWNARGTVRGLLDSLYRISLAPLRLKTRVRTGFNSHIRSEHLFLYLPGLDEVRELASGYESNQEFFKALESTYISELINDVRIRVSINKADAPLTFRELSEGEQQLLLVLGLMRFTKEEESLFLLDEPDTHLNPAWSVQYKQFLHDFGGLDAGSQVLMATHDPLVVASLTKDEVRILERREDSRIVALEPLEDPRGMGVGALLTSDVYGLRSQLDLETLRKLDRKRELASRESVLTPEEEQELSALGHELRGLGLLLENRDPEFQEFLRAKFRAQGQPQDEVVLSREEIEQNRQEAAEIVRDLFDVDD